MKKPDGGVCVGAISIHLPSELEAKLRAVAEEQGKSVSRVVAEALEAYFEKRGGEEE